MCQTCKSYKRSTHKESLFNLMVPVSSKVENGTPVELELCLQTFFGGSLVEDVNCTACDARRTFLDIKRFKSYPKVLAVVL